MLVRNVALPSWIIKGRLFQHSNWIIVEVMESRTFKKKIWSFYRSRGRDLPWRRTQNPYRILVSEIMLQQTQVERVKTFYEKFIKRFPNFAALARAKRSEVLGVWQGLGYNRRALALHELAGIIMRKHGGKLPHERAALETLPGIGPYTAGAIRTFAFGEPEIFIETNIRRVFINFFFPNRKKVSDKEILPLIKKTLNHKDPRAWYFALMDYGAMIGATAKKKNPNRRSAHYARQSKFSGSDRELRGQILRLVLTKKEMKLDDLVAVIPQPRTRILRTATALAKEGFFKSKTGAFSL